MLQIFRSFQDLFLWPVIRTDSVSFNIFNYFLLLKAQIKKVLSFSFLTKREEGASRYFSFSLATGKRWHLHYNRQCLWLGALYKYIVFTSPFNYALLWNPFIIKFVYCIHKLFLYHNTCMLPNLFINIFVLVISLFSCQNLHANSDHFWWTLKITLTCFYFYCLFLFFFIFIFVLKLKDHYMIATGMV
jgi:hypothetical protein